MRRDKRGQGKEVEEEKIGGSLSVGIIPSMAMKAGIPKTCFIPPLIFSLVFACTRHLLVQTHIFPYPEPHSSYSQQRIG